MPSHADHRVLPYEPQQMFDLVADVANYPKFLPWTAAARVKSVQTIDDYELMTADLVISFKVFRERFTSQVTLRRPQLQIETRYLDGPFKHLNSLWSFQHDDAGCNVSFEVDFEFKNKLLQGAAGLFFHEAMSRIIHSFEARAKVLYLPKVAHSRHK